MGCRDVHAATVSSFSCGIASVAGLFAGTSLPNWRKSRSITFNRNEKNSTIYTGSWVKCARYDGSSDCSMYDRTWYSSVDQSDSRVLQFASPLSIVIAMGALLLCSIGMCNTAFNSSVPNIKSAKCSVNSAGCHSVAGLSFFSAGTVSLSPSIWAIFYNSHLNRKFEPVFTFDYAVFVTIASSGGSFMTALSSFVWYCACKSLSSPFWQPSYSHAPGMHTYSQPYSSRSRLSAIEIDIPVVSHST